MDGINLVTYQFVRCPAETAARIWPQVEGFIKGALKRGHLENFYEPHDVLAMILLNQADLWLVHNNERIDAAFVTRFCTYPRSKTLYVSLIGGRNMKAWLRLVDEKIDEFARQWGCKYVEGATRQGWARLGRFKITGVSMIRPV